MSVAASVDVWLDEADERALRRGDGARAVAKEPLV